MTYKFRNTGLYNFYIHFYIIFLLVFSLNSFALTIEKEDTSVVDLFKNDFHRQNAGKIIFSKYPVEIGNEDDSGLSDSFSCSDNIWGVIFLKNSFKNLTQSNNFEVCQFIIVDGFEMAHYFFRMSPEKIEQTYLKTEIIVSPDKAVTKGVRVYVKGLSAISPGKHFVKVAVRIQQDTVAEGEFSLDCSEGSDYIRNINNEFELKILKCREMPKPALHDVVLESEIFNSLTDLPGTTLKVVLTDNGWTEFKNTSGGILYRIINAAIAYKKPDGKCSMVYISFRQDYDGKSFGKIEKNAVGNIYDIQCENVK